MTAQTNAARSGRSLYWIPIFGWMLRDLDAGHRDAPLWFMLIVVMVGGIAGIIWGVWAFLALFLTLTPIFLIGYCLAAFSAISDDLGRTHRETLDLRARASRAQQ